MSSRTPADIPDLGGRTAVVTGANSGIGFHAARELAAHCALEGRGNPCLVGSSGAAQDEATDKRLWEESGALTAVRYDFEAAAALPAA